MSNFDEAAIREQVLLSMSEHHITPKHELTLDMDGQLHRFSVEVDKNGGKSGAYIIHSDGMSPNWE